MDFLNTHEDSSSLIHVDHDQSEVTENNFGSSTTPNWNNWNKLRHALSFSRRRKRHLPMSSGLSHTERTIPAISISFESDDDRLNDPKHQRKKTQSIRTANNSRRELNNDDSEDEDLIEFRRQGISPVSTSSYLPTNSTIMDDDNSFSRKQSKIGIGNDLALIFSNLPKSFPSISVLNKVHSNNIRHAIRKFPISIVSLILSTQSANIISIVLMFSNDDSIVNIMINSLNGIYV